MITTKSLLSETPTRSTCLVDETPSTSTKGLSRIFLLGIKSYQRLVSPMFPPSCRFHPSCSSFALEAFQRFGAFHGLKLTCLRLLRCHPFSQGGFDPVSEMKQR